MRMNKDMNRFRWTLLGATVLAGLYCGTARADIDDGELDNTGQLPLPSGQFVTPTAATGAVFTTLNPGLAAAPNFIANGAIKTAVSPDGTTLLVMTSGYNLVANSSGGSASTSQFIFVYDISGGNERTPVQKQVIQVPDTYVGLVWAPDGSKFYVSGGTGDKVWIYGGSTAAGWTVSGSIPLGHLPFVPANSPFFGLILNGVGFEEETTTAGLGLSADGSVLVAANIYNDSISVINTATNTLKFEYDLRPYNTSGTPGVAGGETPFTVAVVGNATAYVSSIRDREIDVVNIAGATPQPDHAHPAARQSQQHGAQRQPVGPVRDAGQQRLGRGDQHGDQYGDRGDFHHRAAGHGAERNDIHRCRTEQPRALSEQPDALRDQRRRQFRGGHSADRSGAAHGGRPGADRLVSAMPSA